MRLTRALKNSFLVSMATVYLSFDRRKTCPKDVLHTVSVCVVSSNDVIPKRRVPTLDQFSPRVERDRAVRVTASVSVW